MIPRGGPDDSLSWFSYQDNEAEALLGQPWKVPRQGVCSWESLVWVPASVCASSCSSGLADMGLSWADGSWDGPAVVSLSSFVSLQISIIA